MLRHALPLIALLACAGCGGGTRSADRPAAQPAAAPVAATVAAEPAPAPAPVKKKGNKKGEPVAIAQPPAPELPADFGLDTTPDQLAAHALITAREQVEAGLAGQASLFQRRDFLVAAWTPALQERQQRQAAIRAERDRVARLDADHASRLAQREEELRTVEADYAHRLELERLRTAPIESH